MLSAKEVSIVYETLLASPGMNDAIKISLNASRKTILLLTKAVEHGIALKDEKADGSLLSSMDSAVLNELKNICESLLDKGGLSEMNAKLSSLQLK